jgi:hypothetical protein
MNNNNGTIGTDGLEAVVNRLLPRFSTPHDFKNFFKTVLFNNVSLDHIHLVLGDDGIDAVYGPTFLKDQQGLGQNRFASQNKVLLVGCGLHAPAFPSGGD